jgi:alpha-mannosidase
MAQNEAKATAPPPKIDYLKKGTVSIMQLSHQDLGWHSGSYEGEAKVVFRSINKAMQMMNEDPDFKYDGESGVWLHDYIQKHPEKVEGFKKRVQERRIQWGAGYAQPYTTLLTGEQLARLFYLGRRWFKAEFGADTKLWHNTDVPGMTAQMPQIMVKAGVDKAYLCRGWNIDDIDTDFVEWSSPDGTKVFCYMMFHYAENIHWRSGAPSIASDNAKMTQWIADQEAEYKKRNLPPVLPHLISKDNVGPRNDLMPMIRKWNEYVEGKNLPKMTYDTMADMMDRVKASPNTTLKQLKGDWPCRWLYEAAPANYQMFVNNRAAARQLTAAEAFTTFLALLDDQWDAYPTEKLFQAWCEATFSCHGIAPDSCIENFNKKYADARKSSKEMLDAALTGISAKVKTSAKGTPVVLFNNLSWKRTDIVRMAIPEGMADCEVLDQDGKQAPSQVSGKNVVFIARDVPSFGYKTFYLVKAGKSGIAPIKPGEAWNKPYENKYFKVTPGKQGIAGIFDKTLKRELLKTDKFEAAQWLNFIYKGQGAGEHTHITKPIADTIDKLGAFTTSWACKESGPLFVTFESKEVETPRGKVSFQLRLYDGLKQIDLSCTMRECDEEAAQQIRLTFPLNADFDNVTYGAPYGKVTVGKDEVQRQLAFKTTRTKEELEAFHEGNKTVRNEHIQRKRREGYLGDTPVRPRETQNWIFAGDGKAGVTIASSVIAWDYMDATREPVDYPVLQPIMLCSAHSCSRWKPFWTQPGDHTFTFSIFSHAGDWRNGRQRGVGVNNPLIPVVVKSNSSGTLPASKSFLSVSADNVIVTAVKKSEDSDDIAIRFYETDGKDETEVELAPAFEIKDARRTNLIEEDAGKMEHSSKVARMDVGKYSIETIKLVPKK